MTIADTSGLRCMFSIRFCERLDIRRIVATQWIGDNLLGTKPRGNTQAYAPLSEKVASSYKSAKESAPGRQLGAYPVLSRNQNDPADTPTRPTAPHTLHCADAWARSAATA